MLGPSNGGGSGTCSTGSKWRHDGHRNPPSASRSTTPQSPHVAASNHEASRSIIPTPSHAPGAGRYRDHMNRRLWVVPLVAALALTGCASSSPEDAFIESLNADTTIVPEKGTREQAIKLAHLICDSMDRGDSAHENAAMLEELGWSLGEAGTFVIAAVDNLCPEHEHLVR